MYKKKNGPTGVIIIIFFIVFFIGPLLAASGELFSGSFVGLFSLFPIVIFLIVLFSIIGSIKGAAIPVKKYNDVPDQKIEIPVEFFEQDKPVIQKSSEKLFNDSYGRNILYYDNGKPVFEKHEK